MGKRPKLVFSMTPQNLQQLEKDLKELEATNPEVKAASERLDATIADIASTSGRHARAHRLPCREPNCEWHRPDWDS